MTERKVVGIHGGKRYTESVAKPLPKALTELRELFKSKLQSGFRSLFDNADDALFDMADKAGSNADQALYFDAMRELRLQKRQIANHCIKEVVAGFNEIYDLNQNSGSSTSELLEWSLLENDELEIKVAVDSMAARVTRESAEHVNDLFKRIKSFLPLDNVDLDSLPISSRWLCDRFTYACNDLDFGIRAKLVVLKLFEKFVLADYPKIYQEANQLLIKRDILPNLASSSPSNKTGRTTGKVKNSINSATTGSNFDQAVSNQDAGNTIETPNSENIVPILGSDSFVESQCGSQFSQLRTLLHSSAPSGKSLGGETGDVVYINRNNLVNMLTDQQHSNTPIVTQGHGQNSVMIDFKELVQQQLITSSNQKLNQVDDDVINLVSMLFDFILEDRQLQPEMKALISRLQIPILKVALMDRTFFDRGGHSARRLLNEIAAAAIGWNPAAEGKRDCLKEKLNTVVERVISEFNNDLKLFDELLNDFLGYIKKESKRGELVEQRTKDSENGRAISIKANQQVNESIQVIVNHVLTRFGKISKDQTIEQQKEQFSNGLVRAIYDHWARLMSLRLLKFGENSEQFQESINTLKCLMDTVLPDLRELDARGVLVNAIPEVMKALKSGLAEIAVPEEEVKSVCKAIEVEHINALEKIHSFETNQREQMDDEAVADLLRDTLDIDDELQAFLDKNNLGDQSNIDSLDDNLLVNIDAKSDLSSSVDTTSINEKEDETKVIATANYDDENESKETEGKESSSLDAESSTAVNTVDLANFVKQVERLSVGTWFEIAKDDVNERCKLAAVIKSIDKHIFVNRSGVKVAEYTTLELASILQQGCLQILNDGLLFDRALESVIGSLRQ